MFVVICYERSKDIVNELCDIEVHTIEYIKSIGISNYLKRIALEGLIVIPVVEEALVFSGIINNVSNLDSILYCQNKYISRMKQRECVADNAPKFFIANSLPNDIRFPLFIKPVRSSFSIGVSVVNTKEELYNFIESNKCKVDKVNKLYSEVINLGYYKHKYLNTYNDFLCEDILTGEQVTVDGYVYGGQVIFIGITKSNFLSNNISFSGFDFPYSFGRDIDNKIYDTCSKVVLGFGLNNTTFNIELMVNEDEVFIVEVHNRFSLQFAPIIKHVTGFNMLKASCDLALGKDPKFARYKGNYQCASIRVLRVDKDSRVVNAPDEEELQRVNLKHGVVIRSFAHKGKKLSDYSQDSKTFRYATIDIWGNSFEDINDKLDRVVKELSYEFEPLH